MGSLFFYDSIFRIRDIDISVEEEDEEEIINKRRKQREELVKVYFSYMLSIIRT